MGRHRIHEIGEALELLRGAAAHNVGNGRPAGAVLVGTGFEAAGPLEEGEGGR
ncbi:hypothetical protein [Streptomyces sp. MUM 16J]|uniref:hypothetical protein n=1 Tax=Streptomyces sp. MUM 16J TaxID=2791988 RepID=UPI001F042635|nr:hypothetical protein [Streptomyces sp. MUM 16J]MCH0560672.1 hypothetical protein [Streptomyces sp. MUM 16J]